MGGFSVDANRLFLVFIFVTEGQARGPAILGFDGFFNFCISKAYHFRICEDSLSGRGPVAAAAAAWLSLRDGGQPDFEFLHLRFYLVAIIHSDVYSSSV